MELLQPSEDASNSSHKCAQLKSEKRTRKSDKLITPTKVTFQSDVSSQEKSLQFPDKLSSDVLTDVSDHPIKEKELPGNSVIKTAVRQEQTTSVNNHLSESSPAIDDAWEFLSGDSFHEKIALASSGQVRFK